MVEKAGRRRSSELIYKSNISRSYYFASRASRVLLPRRRPRSGPAAVPPHAVARAVEQEGDGPCETGSPLASLPSDQFQGAGGRAGQWAARARRVPGFAGAHTGQMGLALDSSSEACVSTRAALGDTSLRLSDQLRAAKAQRFKVTAGVWKL